MEGSTAGDSGSQFTTLEGALEYWGKLNDRRHAWKEVAEIATRLEAAAGKIVEYRVPNGRPYVAIYFADQPKLIGAFVHVGHVDHNESLEGSTWLEDYSKYRSFLSTSSGESSGGAKKAVAKAEVCPTCHMVLPLTGKCDTCD